MVRRTECKYKLCLFTRKLHRVPLSKSAATMYKYSITSKSLSLFFFLNKSSDKLSAKYQNRRTHNADYPLFAIGTLLYYRIIMANAFSNTFKQQFNIFQLVKVELILSIWYNISFNYLN